MITCWARRARTIRLLFYNTRLCHEKPAVARKLHNDNSLANAELCAAQPKDRSSAFVLGRLDTRCFFAAVSKAGSRRFRWGQEFALGYEVVDATVHIVHYSSPASNPRRRSLCENNAFGGLPEADWVSLGRLPGIARDTTQASGYLGLRPQEVKPKWESHPALTGLSTTPSACVHSTNRRRLVPFF
ncbi:hypothetical protein BDZ45DRAFT_795471 [Acephala macrosclerotiorum]|nr:hypothetical protein BDZ45DRAFT_795471 [Acephala macrosclerotiorum]